MARPIQYLFCRYQILHDGEVLGAEAEFNLISENQGEELEHGREKNGVQPLTLFTDPTRSEHDGRRVHSFEVGFKPGTRTVQEYNPKRRRTDFAFERDRHTKLGHIVTIPELGVMAVRDRGGEDMIYATQSIRMFRSLTTGLLGEDSDLNVTFGDDEDVEHAIRTWELKDYRYTARPINPDAGPLGKLRSQMYEEENVGREVGRVVAAEGQSLRKAGGTLGQTYDMYENGYAAIGFSGYTEHGRSANIPKPEFHQDRQKNLAAKEDKPRFIRVAFDPEDDIVNSVSEALVAFYLR